MGIFIETKEIRGGKEWEGRGDENYFLMGSFCLGYEKVLEVGCGDGLIILCVYLMLLNCTLKMVKMGGGAWLA